MDEWLMSTTKLKVRKSNNLVEIGENISKPAKIFVLYLISQMPDELTEFTRLDISYEQLKKIVNIDGKKRISTIREAEKMMDELGNNPLKFENEEFRDTVTWFTKMRYYKKKRMWQFYFHDELKRHLLQLREQFTMYNFWYTVGLSSSSIKMYELMKRYQYLGACKLSIKKQKYFLGIEDKYPEYYEYRRNILDVAQKELERYTDVKFTYEAAEKKGKSIISHRFTIKENKPKVIPEPLKKLSRQQRLPFDNYSKSGVVIEKNVAPESEGKVVDVLDESTIETLKGWGGKPKMIANLVAQYGKEKILYQCTHTKNAMTAGKIKSNTFGWFMSALKGDYVDPTQEGEKKKQYRRRKQEKLANKKQELEKQLIDIQRERNKAEQTICSAIITEYPDLLIQIIEEGKSNIVIATALRNGMTAQEMYDKGKFEAAFIKADIQKRYPNRFSAVHAAFDQPITRLKKQVEML